MSEFESWCLVVVVLRHNIIRTSISTGSITGSSTSR